MKNTRKIIAIVCAVCMLLALCACGTAPAQSTAAPAPTATAAPAQTEESRVYKIGICNYVDDASLNQIVENIRSRLALLEGENDVSFEINYDNCNADAAVMEQIIANFIADGVDLMVGVATPVAMRMQALTEDNQIPVVFAAVSDPEGAGLVESNARPGANVTGTSDYLDTNAVMNLIFALKPETESVGLLYDIGQDSSAAPIAAAREYLSAKGIKVVEHTGSTTDEIMLAARAMAADKVDAVFTPTDNSIMTAELAIYEILAEAGIPHFTGADSFALNGAFLGYGVDYANLGAVTAEMIFEILVNGEDVSSMPVRTFDNGTATVNSEICAALGYDYDATAELFAPYCTAVKSIITAESFSDIA